MKRMHLHIGVENFEESVQFYNALFGAAPVKTKADYAKWMLSDPLLNFAISTRSGQKGLDHLGIQIDEAAELEAFRSRIVNSLSTHNDGETVCCYAKSEKSWLEDPNGIAWEAYHLMEDAQIFSEGQETESACCVPTQKVQSSCCEPSETTGNCCG